jgi:solute:Na+ symporter, SSS family
VVAYIFTKISVSLYAGSLVMREVAGWDFYTSAIVMVLATGAYTIVGGLAAVIYTELLQAFVLIGAAILMTLIGLSEVGGFGGLRAALPGDFFHMIKPMTDPNFPWTGIFLGAPILGIWYWCTDQVIVQRVLSGKSEAHARGGAIFAAFLKILPVFILVLPGLIARALYPDIDGDQAYPALVVRLLPLGDDRPDDCGAHGRADVVAGRHVQLGLDADHARCVPAPAPGGVRTHLVFVGRMVTRADGRPGILWVPFIPYLSSQVYIYLQSVQAYISPPIAAVFLLGVFWPRANRAGAIASLVTGGVIGATRFVLEVHAAEPAGGRDAVAHPDRRDPLPAFRDPDVRHQHARARHRVAVDRRRNRGEAAGPHVRDPGGALHGARRGAEHGRHPDGRLVVVVAAGHRALGVLRLTAMNGPRLRAPRTGDARRGYNLERLLTVAMTRPARSPRPS